MSYKPWYLIPLVLCSFGSNAKEPPKSYSFEIKQVFDSKKNKEEYQSLIQQVRESQDAFKQDESIGAALRPICTRGHDFINGMSKVILNVEDVEFKQEYEISYLPGTDFNADLPSYIVDCNFFTKKSENLPKSVKVNYRETMKLDKFSGSYEFKVSIREQ
ncbi:hypothetical protein [Vibrio parahaemolyticus]|uniref:hypothetical protein n=1 Tax=Vibrio parahaemolyticus TaxID=670 RepID=UPI0004A275B5|nr:hypothetical protein [Vibrio parahaemolyticus]HBC3401725.1 hypothetical protein [Vibrio parahaemolyticus]